MIFDALNNGDAAERQIIEALESYGFHLVGSKVGINLKAETPYTQYIAFLPGYYITRNMSGLREEINAALNGLSIDGLSPVSYRRNGKTVIELWAFVHFDQ